MSLPRVYFPKQSPALSHLGTVPRRGWLQEGSKDCQENGKKELPSFCTGDPMSGGSRREQMNQWEATSEAAQPTPTGTPNPSG